MMDIVLVIRLIALAVLALAAATGIAASILLFLQKKQERLGLVVLPTLLVLILIFMSLTIWIPALAISLITLITGILLSISYYGHKKMDYLAYSLIYALTSIALIFLLGFDLLVGA